MAVSSLARDQATGTTNPGSRPDRLLLSIGNDALLLSYREQVLRWAGWCVKTVSPQDLDPALPASRQPSPLDGHASDPDLCIVCHTLSPSERARIADMVRSRWPGSQLLAISAGQIGPGESARYDCVVENLDGPAALIRSVRECLPKR
jgi:hypothetical protein